MTLERLRKIHEALIVVFPSEALEILNCIAELMKAANVKIK